MKKIVPFNNTLEFSTDVKEITAISLEHEINTSKDIISGVFYINGEYKITEGSLGKEPFNFELPFDIALSDNYKEDTLIVDIDDFRYELITDKKLKVNIDLYIDGEIEERTILEPEIEPEPVEIVKELKPIDARIDLFKDMLSEPKEETMENELEINNENTNINNNNNDNDNFKDNILNNNEEKYVTYRVYKVLENDNLDTILTKYNVSKEMLSEYNDIENIKPGDKLIIPTNEK